MTTVEFGCSFLTAYGRFMAQVGRLGAKVGSHLLTRVNSAVTVSHDDSTINKHCRPGIIIIIIIIIVFVSCYTVGEW